jgi:hypothetical protein
MLSFDIIKDEIEAILPKSPIESDLTHSRLVLKWVLVLKPEADDAFKIAALSHDIDRAMTGITEKDLVDYSKIDEFKKAHAVRSANFIADILKRHEYPAEVISKVQHLVENHECGGDDQTDIIMSADSLAYFEYNIPGYLNRYGEEQTKKKIQFMHKRLSPEAQKLVAQINFSSPDIVKLVKDALV